MLDSSPFGSATRTRALLALSLLTDSYARELARVLFPRCNGRSGASSGMDWSPPGPWAGPASFGWTLGTSPRWSCSGTSADSPSRRRSSGGGSPPCAAGHGEPEGRCEGKTAGEPCGDGRARRRCAPAPGDPRRADRRSAREPPLGRALPIGGRGLRAALHRGETGPRRGDGIDRLHPVAGPLRPTLALAAVAPSARNSHPGGAGRSFGARRRSGTK